MTKLKTEGNLQILEDNLLLIFLEKKFSGNKLSDSKQVSAEDWKKLSSKLCDRPWDYLKFHWMTWTKTCLLQHLSGTRNLNIEKMLVSYNSDFFGDSVVDWDKVSLQQEFAGHTKTTLSIAL